MLSTNLMKSFVCRHPYCLVESRNPRSTAALPSTGSVDSTGSDFGITPVASIVSVCLECVSSIVATWPSIPAARFAFCLCFIRFVFAVGSCFVL